MDAQQISTDLTNGIDTKAIESQMFVLTSQQQAWIDYKAVGGIIVEDERLRKMTVSELAERLGVDRTTLYNWRESIPDFWQRVETRRKQIHSQEFLTLMHEKFKLKAYTFDNWAITEAWLINFDPGYITPKIKVEHDVTDNYAALLATAAKHGIIEGEIVEQKSVDAGTSVSNQPPHPQTS